VLRLGAIGDLNRRPAPAARPCQTWDHHNGGRRPWVVAERVLLASRTLTRELRVRGRETSCGGTSRTTETAVVDKLAEDDEDAGHHRGHAH
jgi:hypothetical protein